MKKIVFLRVVKEILDEAWLGFIMTNEKLEMSKKNLNDDAYERIPVIYHARSINMPINEENNKKRNPLKIKDRAHNRRMRINL